MIVQVRKGSTSHKISATATKKVRKIYISIVMLKVSVMIYQNVKCPPPGQIRIIS